MSSSNVNDLKSLIASLNLEHQTRKFLHSLYPIIESWQGEIPSLKDIFTKQQIDHLLLHCIRSNEFNADTLVDFVIKAGYKDEIVTTASGEPLVRYNTPVHYALPSGDSNELVAKLFRIYDNWEVNYSDEETGLTHFQVACMAGCSDVVEAFLEHGVDPNSLPADPNDSIHDPPLHYAVKYNYEAIVKSLLEHGADPNAPNTHGLTPLHVICKCSDDDVELLRMFCEASKKVDRTVNLNAEDRLGSTPMKYTLATGHVKLMRGLLELGVDPNAANRYGKQALHFIAVSGEANELAEAFFEACDALGKTVLLQESDANGYTALHWCVAYRNWELAKRLMLRGADPNQPDANHGLNCLHLICLRGRTDKMTSCFWDFVDEAGIEMEIDATNNYGCTPLHCALLSGLKEFAVSLMKRGADPNAVDCQGCNSIHLAVKSEHFGTTADALYGASRELDKPLALDAADMNGVTPLQTALSNCRMDMAEWLLRRGADPNLALLSRLAPLHTIGRVDEHGDMVRAFFKIARETDRRPEIEARDACGRTPLQHAVIFGRWRVIEFLLAMGADPNTADDRGTTPLHVICQKGDEALELLEIYLMASEGNRWPVQLDPRDERGLTPLCWALDMNHVGIANVLLNYGADPNV